MLSDTTFRGFDAVWGDYCIEHGNYCSVQAGRHGTDSFVMTITLPRQCSSRMFSCVLLCESEPKVPVSALWRIWVPSLPSLYLTIAQATDEDKKLVTGAHEDHTGTEEHVEDTHAHRAVRVASGIFRPSIVCTIVKEGFTDHRRVQTGVLTEPSLPLRQFHVALRRVYEVSGMRGTSDGREAYPMFV